MKRCFAILLRSHLWSRAVAKIQSCIDKSVQAAGPTYIFLAFFLMSSVIYLFFATILPTLHNMYSLRGLLHAAIGCWLILNVFFNYFYCIFTDPGSPPADFLDSGTRWCKHCHKNKPAFTHHCHICKRCILRMDHHCPWMHNCVGFYNYRFFFVFLFYLWIGCAYAVYMSSQLLFADDYNEQEWQLLFTFVLSFGIFGALSCLFGWHIFLVVTAQTTIDFYGNRQRKLEAKSRGKAWVNVFDLGAAHNFRNVFYSGGRHLWWTVMLLPSRARPVGDGISFRTRYQLDVPEPSVGSSREEPEDEEQARIDFVSANGPFF
ncbi:probable protein S-acyltransferase 15 isoform X2 [Selaginella moellendorffii]|uniref:probable protein S-acyltransferase 15 isoform X2 n=1 Tax=Selaginella moellendorffii TaxID=88036 RepID=UPI000D1C2952|nr:probable protein S-acyltransferase 15 isoform X2 [Selaginella moellendorffii]|eukprot:XP_024534034.1 probable protein S-acyltransferase 15 isoform X2 [Selaginella moellendorffii]